MGMKIEGAKEIQAALLALPDKVAKKFMVRALKAGAQPVLAAAKAACPVKSGALRDGLRIATSNRGDQSTATVQTDKATYYGNMQEFGTKKMKPHPFMEQALEQNAKEATEIIAATLKQDIEREAFK